MRFNPIKCNAFATIMLFVMLLGITSTHAIAQNVQAQQTIEGFVIDEATGKPVSCKIYIFTPSGKKIQINSNATDGAYLQTLSEAGPHKFVFQDYNIYRKEVIVDIGATQKFRALKQNFPVQLVLENAAIFSVRGFERNSPTITPDAKRKLSDLTETLTANQQMRAVLILIPDEDQFSVLKAKAEADYLKSMEAWNKAKKKLKKKQTPPPEPQRLADPTDPNVALMQSRLAAVRAELRGVKNGDERLMVEIASMPASTVVAAQAPAVVERPAKGKKAKASKKGAVVTPAVPASSSHATLVAKIGKVKRLFD